MAGPEMPTIEINVADRIQRHLSAVRIMSYMVFPDDTNLRSGAEITFRTILADSYSESFAELPTKDQARIMREWRKGSGTVRPDARAKPSEWMRKRLFDAFLRSSGGTEAGALKLANSPSAKQIELEWGRRWWSIVYTGKLLCLIASIWNHCPEVDASLNKAIHILCATEGNDKRRMAGFRQCGFPGVYESSLKKAWVKFRPVAHLCAAYATTETDCYEDQLSRDFSEYWAEPPALYDDDIFMAFCVIAKSAEAFATSFYPRGQHRPLIPEEEIFALPDEIFADELSLPPPRTLTEDELAALKSYRAPKRFD